MDTKIQVADDALHKANILIGQEALVKGNAKTKENRERTRKILSATQQVVDVVEGVSELLPASKAATVVFKALIRLEANRRENNEQIVVVCYNMSITMYALRYLDARVDQEDELSEKLQEVMAGMEDTMKEFGDFADFYYTKARHLLVRFLRSGGFKQRLASFVDDFARYREQITLLVNTQSWGRQEQINERLEEVQRNSELILQRLDTPNSASERAVIALINRHGGPEHIVQDRAALDAIAHSTELKKADSSPVTTATRGMLSEDLDVLLQQNQESFERKLESSKKELAETIARSTAAILHRFDQGPHEQLEDPDIRELWKKAGWKLTVKTRYFGEALFDHFSNKVSSGVAIGQADDESWALDILRKVIYYPAIGEAIDEDSSGSLSVHEVNHFLLRNTHPYSTPVWLAYWAVGWRYMNSCLTNDVCGMLDKIESGCTALAKSFEENPEHSTLESVLSAYRDTVGDLQSLGSWNDWNDDGMDALVEDMNENTSAKLEAIAREIHAREEEHMKTQLEQLEYTIDDPALLTNITGVTGLRIEQVFWSLLALILEHHVECINSQHDPETTSVEDLAAAWEARDATLTVLLVEIYQRYKSLQRSWRSQKLSVSVEVESYAGGFFYGWYTESEKPGKNRIKLLEAFVNPDDAEDSDEYEDEDEDQDGDEQASQSSGQAAKNGQQPSSEISQQITMINARLDATNARLDATDGLLRQLLDAVQAFSGHRSSPPHVQGRTAHGSKPRKTPQRRSDGSEADGSESRSQADDASDQGGGSGDEDNQSRANDEDERNGGKEYEDD